MTSQYVSVDPATGNSSWCFPEPCEAAFLEGAPTRVAAAGGNFYFASGAREKPSFIYAVDKTGKLVWDRKVCEYLATGNANTQCDGLVGDPIVNDGVVYAATAAHKIVALSATDGTVKWQWPVGKYDKCDIPEAQRQMIAYPEQQCKADGYCWVDIPQKCNVSTPMRKVCGSTSTTKAGCENEGCCWEQAPAASCNVSVSQRVACATGGTNATCAAQGCCWDSDVPCWEFDHCCYKDSTPSCFHTREAQCYRSLTSTLQIIESQVAVDGDSVYFVANVPNAKTGRLGGVKLIALDAKTGTQRWAQPWGASSTSTTYYHFQGVTVANGTMYVLNRTASYHYTLVALSAADGTAQWKAPLGNVQSSSLTYSVPIVTAGVAVSSGPDVVAVDATSGKELWRFAGGKANATQCNIPPVSGQRRACTHGDSKTCEDAGCCWDHGMNDSCSSQTQHSTCQAPVGPGQNQSEACVAAGCCFDDTPGLCDPSSTHMNLCGATNTQKEQCESEGCCWHDVAAAAKCNVTKGARQTCGSSTSTKAQCEADGCCWEAQPQNQCKNVSVAERVACGSPGGNNASCVAEGCCWDSDVPCWEFNHCCYKDKTPSCFRSQPECFRPPTPLCFRTLIPQCFYQKNHAIPWYASPTAGANSSVYVTSFAEGTAGSTATTLASQITQFDVRTGTVLRTFDGPAFYQAEYTYALPSIAVDGDWIVGTFNGVEETGGYRTYKALVQGFPL